MKNPFRNSLIAVLVLMLITVGVFAWSVSNRSEYFGVTSEYHHHHLTGSTVIFVNNWLEKGALSVGFTMIENPDSVEFADVKDRVIYDSYPPGCILEMYLVARLTFRSSVDYAFVESVNLANQLIITCLLVGLVWHITRNRLKMSWLAAFMLSLIPIALQIFMPAPYYFFQNVYFSDGSVLLWFALTIFTEFLIPDIKNKHVHRLLVGLQYVAMFMGMYTDYLYLFVILCLYVKRLMVGEIPLPWSRKQAHAFRNWILGTLKTGGASILALLLFVVQVLINGPVRVLDMFLYRTGLGNGGDGWANWFEPKFWQEYMTNGYGTYAEQIMKYSLGVLLVLLFVYLIGVNLKKKPFTRSKSFETVIGAALLFIVPCFLQVNALRNHSAIHDFSTQKFSLVMSVVPLVFAPLSIWFFVRSIIGREDGKYAGNTQTWVRAACYVLLLVTVGYTFFVHTGATLKTDGGLRLEYPSSHVASTATTFKRAEQFFPVSTPLYAEEGELIRANTDYYDVVFTDEADYEVSNIRPQSLSQTMKRVYRISTLNGIYWEVQDITENYRICFLDKAGSVNSAEIQKLLDASEIKASSGDMILYSIDKAAFLALIQ